VKTKRSFLPSHLANNLIIEFINHGRTSQQSLRKI